MSADVEAEVPVDKLAKVYLKIRAKRQELTKVFEAEDAALKAQQDEVAGVMKDHMQALKVKSMNTEFGTVILSLKTRYYTQDWDSFKTFVVKNNAVDLLERRIAQKNIEQFIKENPELVPPGLNSDASYEVSVRKPTS